MRDADDLAHKIIELSRSKEKRVNMGKGGEQRAKDFSLKAMLDKYYKLYA